MTIFRKRNGPGASGAMEQSVEEKAVQIPRIQTEPKPVRPSTPTLSKRRRTNVNPARNTIGLLARTMRESDLVFFRDSRQHLPTCTRPLLLPVARACHLLTKVAIPLSTVSSTGMHARSTTTSGAPSSCASVFWYAPLPLPERFAFSCSRQTVSHTRHCAICGDNHPSRHSLSPFLVVHSL
jgi:hypothetical protein